MKRTVQLYFLLAAVILFATNAFAVGAKVKKVDAVPEDAGVRIEIELTEMSWPTVLAVGDPNWLIVEFKKDGLLEQPKSIKVNKNGVREVRVDVNQNTPIGTRIIVGMDSMGSYSFQSVGNKLVLKILPGAVKTAPEVNPDSFAANRTNVAPEPDHSPELIAKSNGLSVPIEHPPIESLLDQDDATPANVRSKFTIKYVTGKSVYIDGGSNAGLRVGMILDVHNSSAAPANGDRTTNSDGVVASLRVVGLATTSAITEVSDAERDVNVGERADLSPNDAVAAARNAAAAVGKPRPVSLPTEEVAASSGAETLVASNHLRSAEKVEPVARPRMAGRIGFDYSGIKSGGSTPGTSTQVGLSVQSDMTNILGTHWNLQGYWRGRINTHAESQDESIDDTLNKTYTMQLFYDNPNSKWVAGVGRLYLPWAVSLDTIDGAYFGRKGALGMTSGVFAGSTPDLTSWDYQPDHRIAGSFVNFTGGNHEGIYYSSTTGMAFSSIRWKLDRPFAFFENELSYKGKFSMYHSLIADQPRGVSTNGIRPGAGISHSYFTAHYQPTKLVSLDLYHNFFRDVPTAATNIVGTGLVDKLLFQGTSGGIHLKPARNFTFYTTLGASEKTGDTHRSLNQMYGATWNEIARTGIRADFHYTKFDSDFGSGNYKVLSVSRQLTNRMFWNVMFGDQHLISQVTTDNSSRFIADSLDINIGRHSYIQSGYTYVNGATLNYRQWYMSWGYRLDKGKETLEYVQTLSSPR